MKVETYDKQRVAPEDSRVPTLGVVQPTGTEQGLHAATEGLASFGGAVGSEYAKARYDAATSDAREKLNQLDDRFTARTNGDTAGVLGTAPASGSSIVDQGDQGTSSEGFLATRGKNAAANSAKVLDAMHSDVEDLAGQMKDETAKRIFYAEAAKKLSNARRTVEAHVAQQTEQYRIDEVNTAADQAVRAAALDPGNDKAIADQMSGVVGSIHAMGRGDAYTETETLKVDQRVAVARINALLSPDRNDVEGAQRVLDQSKYALGDKYDDLSKVVQTARDRGQGEAIASGIIDGARKKNGFIDEAKAVASFEAIPPAQRSQTAKTAFDHLLALEKARETSMKSDAFDTALSAYLGRHNLNDVPPATKVWLQANDPKGWHQLELMVNADREHARGAGPTDDQRRAMTQFEVDLHDHPDKYATMSEAQFHATVWPQLAKNDRERAGALFASAHGQAAKPGALDPQESKMLLQTGRDAGLFPPKQNDPSKWNDDEAELYYKAVETLQAQATAYRRANGKAPPFEQVKKWTDDLVLKGKVPHSGMLWDTSTTRLEAITRGTDFEPKWSDEERAAVAKKLQSAGLQASDDNIDTALRRLHGLASRPAQAPAAPTPPPKSGDISAEWGLDLSEPSADYGD